MNIEIIEEPRRFTLFGLRDVVEGERYSEVGLRLMNSVWQTVKHANLRNTGINHWVYLSLGTIFVGVELLDTPPTAPESLETLSFELTRYAQHRHVGPYQALPQKWRDLTALLATQNKQVQLPSLEIYGHHCDESTQPETTILLGLGIKPSKPMKTIDRASYEALYAGQPRWEIGRPQKAFINVAEQITGSILDSGCGTGENALFFARRGHPVTGIDFLAEPIVIANKNAEERGFAVTFFEKDALTLRNWSEQFDNVIDSGLFHSFNDDDRQRYVEGLAAILKPNGRFWFLCFSDEEPGTQGPRRVSRQEIAEAFAHGWQVESIEPSHYEVRPDPASKSSPADGPKAWFAIVRRCA